MENNLDLVQQKQKLQKDISELVTAQNREQVLLETIKKEVEVEEARLNKLDTEADKQEENAKEGETRISMLKRLIRESKDSYEKALNGKAEIEAEVEALRKEKADLVTEIADKRSSMGAELSQYKAQIASDKKKIQETIDDTKRELADVTERNKEANKQKNRLESEINTLIAERDNKQALKDDAERELVRVTDLMAVAQGEIASFTANKDSYIKAVEEAKAKKDQAEKDLEGVRIELTKNIKELEDRRGEVLEINKKKVDLASQERSLNYKLESIKKIYEEAGIPWTE